MAVGCLVLRYGSARLDDLAGAGKAMPLTMLAFVLAGLSLIGVPLTAGFVSKWMLIQAMLEIGGLGIVLMVFILISSLLAVVYIWKVVEVAYFQQPAAGAAATHKEAPSTMLALLYLLVFANFWFGIDPSIPLKLASMEAASLLGGSP
jgi:multicomponent Na+:H+ antiporter subunit D